MTSTEDTKSKGEYKVVIRHLPSRMTLSEIEEQLSPLPDHSFIHFAPSHPELFPHSYATLYIGMKDEDEILEFSNRFNGYIFVDSSGNESQAIVEFAPYQKIPHSSRDGISNDQKMATIESDPMYQAFLEELGTEGQCLISIEEQLKEIEIRNEKRLMNADEYVETPLIKFFFEEYRNRSTLEMMRKKGPRKFEADLKLKREKEKERDEERYEKRKMKNFDRNDSTKFRKAKEVAPSRHREQKEQKESRDQKEPKESDVPNARVRDLLRTGGRGGPPIDRDDDTVIKKERGEVKRGPPRQRERRNKDDEEKKKGNRPERPIYRPGANKKKEVDG